jgi:hypothetical protein
LEGALGCFKEVGDRHLEALVLYNMAEISSELKDSERAFSCCDRALNIATELGLPLAEECQKLKEEISAS